MPYKDPERKKAWERLHRPERLARRELRSTEATQPTRPRSTAKEHNVAGFLIPLVAGGALDASSRRDLQKGLGLVGIRHSCLGHRPFLLL